MQEYIILWFSGTGNTLLAAQWLKHMLIALGAEAELANICDNPKQTFPDKTTIICWPVYSYGMPRLVNRYVQGMPAGSSPIYMLATMGGGAGGAMDVAARMLSVKGYDVRGGIEILMPNNYLGGRKPDHDSVRQLLDRAKQQVEEFAQAIYRGEGLPISVNLISRILARMVNKAFYMSLSFSSRQFSVSSSECNRCGICARLCPIGNIIMEEYPRWGKECEQCLRCLHVCPQAAIDIMGAIRRGRPQYLVPNFHTLLDSAKSE